MSGRNGGIHAIVLDSIEDGVIAVTSDGRITTFNGSAARILGIDAGDATGRLLGETFLEHEGLDELTQALLDCVSGDAPLGRRPVRIRADGDRRVLTVATSALEGLAPAGSSRIGVVATFSDVTEAEALREAERALSRQVETQYEELRSAYHAVEEREGQLAAARRGARIARLAGLAVACVLVGAASYVGLRSPAEIVVETAAEPVLAGEVGGTVTRVEPGRLHATVVVAGRLVAEARTAVASPVDGVVESLRFRYGEEVKLGQVLVSLDTAGALREYRSLQGKAIESASRLSEVEDWEESPAMQTARRAVAQAGRALEKQRIEVDETAFLLGEGIIAESEHQQAVEEYENRVVEEELAKAELAQTRRRGDANAIRAARFAHRNIEEQLKEMELALKTDAVRAPASGIAAVAATASPAKGGQAGGGGRLAPGRGISRGEVLLAIVDVKALSVAAVVAETEIVKLRIGQQVTVTSDAFPGLELAGAIAKVASEALDATRGRARGPAGFAVSARLRDPGPEARERLRLGMSVDMRVVTRDVPDALLVPVAAVRRTRGGLEVLRRDPATGEVGAVPVETGITTLGRVEITRGLAAGDEIVVPDGGANTAAGWGAAPG